MTYELQTAPLPPRRQPIPKAPVSVDKACIAHEEAYKAVFGIVPKGYTYATDTKLIHIAYESGFEPGVNLQRLKQLTKMLELRKG